MFWLIISYFASKAKRDAKGEGLEKEPGVGGEKTSLSTKPGALLVWRTVIWKKCRTKLAKKNPQYRFTNWPPTRLGSFIPDTYKDYNDAILL